MGRPKESLPFGTDTMLGRAAAAATSCCAPVVVVAQAGQDLPALPAAVERTNDDRPGEGPLAAIATGLRFLVERHGFGPRDAGFVTACDTPFVTAAAIVFLHERLGAASLVLPRTSDGLHPLCAIWRVDTAATIDSLLAAGVRTPRRVAEFVPTRFVDEDELRAFDPELRMLRNVNAPADYDRARADDRS
ncbi:MAG: molybdenum cofactor guanylyltransferase [Planctomycetes bacterium]|nr:molybdenum cofactor guanylyltransferase [Planctomycetota bacterium]